MERKGVQEMRSMSILAALMIGAWESSRREIPSRLGYAAPESYPNGPGWTCAHVKRTALKARNRARHKAAVRRAPR